MCVNVHTDTDWEWETEAKDVDNIANKVKTLNSRRKYEQRIIAYVSIIIKTLPQCVVHHACSDDSHDLQYWSFTV